MSRRKRQQALEQQGREIYNNEDAKSYAPQGKIATTKYIRPANVHQKQLVKSMKNNILTIGSGEAGVGKSLLALFTGIELLNNKESCIEKILYLRANIKDCEEVSLGAMPGTLQEKTLMLAYPILDNLEVFMDKKTIEYTLEQSKIEVLPMMFMRGRSFQNTFVILDEAQNVTMRQMKTLLTRLSESSKLVIIGDNSQCDIDKLKNGLSDLEWRLNKKALSSEEDQQTEVDYGLVKFDKNDILRSELTKFAIELYNL